MLLLVGNTPSNIGAPMYEPSSDVRLAFRRMASAPMYGFNIKLAPMYDHFEVWIYYKASHTSER